MIFLYLNFFFSTHRLIAMAYGQIGMIQVRYWVFSDCYQCDKILIRCFFTATAAWSSNYWLSSFLIAPWGCPFFPSLIFIPRLIGKSCTLWQCHFWNLMTAKPEHYFVTFWMIEIQCDIYFVVLHRPLLVSLPTLSLWEKVVSFLTCCLAWEESGITERISLYKIIMDRNGWAIFWNCFHQAGLQVFPFAHKWQNRWKLIQASAKI